MQYRIAKVPVATAATRAAVATKRRSQASGPLLEFHGFHLLLEQANLRPFLVRFDFTDLQTFKL